MLLKNENIFLRALEPSDISTIMLWENDPQIWQYGDTSAPISHKMIWEYIQNYSADIYAQRQIRLMICSQNGDPAGLIDLFDFDPQRRNARLGLFIDPAWQNKGFARQAAQLMLQYAAQVLHLRNIVVEIAADNAPSRHIFESLGFTLVGTLRQWLVTPRSNGDLCVYQSSLSPNNDV